MIAIHVFKTQKISAIRIRQSAHGGNLDDPDRMQIHAIRAYGHCDSETGAFYAEGSGPEWFRPLDYKRWVCLEQRGKLYGLKNCAAAADSTLHHRCLLKDIFSSKIGKKHWSSYYGNAGHWVAITFRKPMILEALVIAWKGHPQAYSVSLCSKNKWTRIFKSSQPAITALLKPPGRHGAIKTALAWEKRRAIIKENILKVMKPFPSVKCDPDMQMLGSRRLKEGRVMELVYSPEPWHRLHAYLALPNVGRPPYPLIIYTMYNRDKALQCALPFVRKGFAVFAPDLLIDRGQAPKGHPYTLQLPFMRRLYGDGGYFRNNRLLYAIGPRKWVMRPEWEKEMKWSAMGKIIWDVSRGLDMILDMPEIDASRVGCTGFSWGGVTSMFVTAFEDRIRAASPQCTWFHSMRSAQALCNCWVTWYHMPGLSKYLRCDRVPKIPFDVHELLALIAPRPLFIAEESRGRRNVLETMNEVRKVYRLYNAEKNFAVLSPNDAHAYYFQGMDWFQHYFFDKQKKQPG